MLRRLFNQCSFELHLKSLEPLLIKGGATVISGPDMAFVRTNRNNQVQPYIPGSSLKGVLRSHAERIARTLKPDVVCDVFDGGKVRLEGCSTRLKEEAKANIKKGGGASADNFDLVCPACRLFGSLLWKGRFQIGDAYLTDKYVDVRPELRDGIGIDRVTGGVAGGAKFDMEVLPAGVEFTTRIDIQNFEVWQLGWVSYVVRDLMEGRLRLGTGTSRGLGRVEAALTALEVSYIGEPEGLSESILGVGALATDEERETYGFKADDRVAKGSDLNFLRAPGSLRSAVQLTTPESQKAFMDRVAPAWNQYVVDEDPITV